MSASSSMLTRCRLLDTLKPYMSSILSGNSGIATLFGTAYLAALSVHRLIIRIHFSYLSLLQPSGDDLVGPPSSPKRHGPLTTGGASSPRLIARNRPKLGAFSTKNNENLYRSTLECLAQLNSTGQWKGCCMVIDAVLSFYSYLDQVTERVTSLTSELKISYEKYTEKVNSDSLLLPLPIYFAVRFTDTCSQPPVSWVMYRFDPSAFSFHFAGIG